MSNRLVVAPAVVSAFSEFNLSPDATKGEVTARYRKLALERHPDKNRNPNTIRDFQSLQKARDVVLQYFEDLGESRSNIRDDESVDILANGVSRVFRKGGTTRLYAQHDPGLVVNEEARRLRQEQLLLRGKKFCTRRERSIGQKAFDENISKLKSNYDEAMRSLQEGRDLIVIRESQLQDSYDQCMATVRNQRSFFVDPYGLVELLRDIAVQYTTKKNKFEEFAQDICRAEASVLEQYNEKRNRFIQILEQGNTELERGIKQEQDELLRLVNLGSISDTGLQQRKSFLFAKHVRWMKEYSQEMHQDQRVFVTDAIVQKYRQKDSLDEDFKQIALKLSIETTEGINGILQNQRQEIEDQYHAIHVQIAQESDSSLQEITDRYSLLQKQAYNERQQKVMYMTLSASGIALAMLLVSLRKKLWA